MTTFIEHHQATEQSLLSHLSHNLPVCLTLQIQPSDFSTSFRGELFGVLKRLAAERLPFERRMVHRYLENRGIIPEQDWHDVFSYTGEDVPGDPDVIRHYANLLGDISNRQKYHHWLETHIEHTTDLKYPLLDALTDHAKVLAETQGKLTNDLAPDAASIYAREKDAATAPFFPCGLTAIDKNVRGLRAGHIWVIAGQYKARKTTVVLNMVKEVLKQGKHVMYVALEDDDAMFFNSLTAIWGNIPFAYIDDPALAAQCGPATVQKIADAKAEIIQQHLRIYDGRKGVHNWKLLPSIIAADKLRYGQVDLVVIDYIQAFSSRYEDLQQIVPMIQRISAEEHVAMIVLSQMNNADMSTQAERLRLGDSMLHTKSTGDLGALCHVGIELFRDDRLMHELMINIKVARKGMPQKTFAVIEPASGTITHNDYNPRFPVEWEQLGIDLT